MYNSKLRPDAVAECISRNAGSAKVVARTFVLPDGNAEVYVRGDGGQPLAFFRINSDGRDTDIDAFVSYETGTDRRGYSASFLRGC